MSPFRAITWGEKKISMHLLSMGSMNGVTGIKGNISFWDSATQAVVNRLQLGRSALEPGAVRPCPGGWGDADSQALALLPGCLYLWNIQLI